MRHSIFAAAAIATAALNAPQASAVVYADTAIDTIIGTGDRGPDGNTDPAITAIGAPDGLFYSPGIGGLLVLGFSDLFEIGANVSAFEITFTCNGVAASGCVNWPETVEIFVGTDWITGESTVADALALNSGFVSQGLITNAQSLVGATLLATSSFSQIALVDRSVLDGRVENANAGFDIDAVGISPIPLPAAGWMLLGGLAGLSWLSRRRA